MELLSYCYTTGSTGTITTLYKMPCKKTVLEAASSRVKKAGDGPGSSNFLTDSCKCPTEEIIGVQNFDFAPKFPRNGGFSVTHFLTGWNLGRGNYAPPPRCQMFGRAVMSSAMTNANCFQNRRIA